MFACCFLGDAAGKWARGVALPSKRKSMPELIEWLKKHPQTVIADWYKWSKAGRADVLQAAHSLVMQEGIAMLRRGEFGSNKALENIKDTSDPSELVRHLASSKSGYGRTPLIAATRAGNVEAMKLLLSWVSLRCAQGFKTSSGTNLHPRTDHHR